MKTPAINKTRIQSVDLLRGMVMIIMALDHTRDYFHKAAFIYEPTDLTHTNVPLFFTRWITHFCAPVFMFLAGTSAFLSGQKKSKKELCGFLVTRGIWLIFLELTVVNFAWYFNVHFPNIDFLVIWALGASMIVLGVLIWLPRGMIFFVGLLLVAGHNLLDNIHLPGNNLKAFGWSLLHDPALYTFKGIHSFVAYPIVSWIGVMALGYCFGNLYTANFDAAKRKRILTWLGSSLIAFFIILRYSNAYGDANHWSLQSSNSFTILSFLNTTKYPPSLLYLSMTLGPAILFLAFSEKLTNPFTQAIRIFGRVPMFYYLLHIYVIHAGAMIAATLNGYTWSDYILTSWVSLEPKLKGQGFDLYVVYLVWISVIFLLYPLCKWYDTYKRHHKEKWWQGYL